MNFRYGIIIALVCMVSTALARRMSDYSGMVFPPDHALNMPVDSLPVHSNSDNYIASIGSQTALHPDFGTSWEEDGIVYPMGIPYNLVGTSQPKVPITFVLYEDESDKGPWPIPRDPFIETVIDWREKGDGDRHMLIIDTSAHILYETGNVNGNTDGTVWEGGCGAVFNLDAYDLRPETWTSADAAGLPIFPLLLRYDEVERARLAESEVTHAIRFTVQNSQKAYVWPARHYASSSTDKNRAPMGLRFRLKASFDISGYTPRMQVILKTMKKYGMIVADNGSNWYFQGTHDERWDDEELNSLKKLRGNNFEAVDITPWTSRNGFDKNSGKVPSGVAVTARLHHAESGRSIVRDVVINKNSITVHVNPEAAHSLQIRLVSPAGKEIASTLVPSSHDNIGIELRGSERLSGVYILIVTPGGGAAFKKGIAIIR